MNERPDSVFNVGSQTGNISNVAGDMTIHGGQQYVAVPADKVRNELLNLRTTLANADFDPSLQRRAEELLSDAEGELDKDRPDAEKVARPVDRLTRLLKEAGAISIAGAALIDPLQRIASWLGDSGRGILRLIQ
jgi:hypothetical protein